MTDLIVPIVHMNGTGKKTLIQQRKDVYTSLLAVEKVLCQMAPNGRDYYVGEPGLLQKAQDQHYRRLGTLKSLMDEMVAECEAIYEQGR